jgi:GT2 family glycosyltransferase
VNTAADIQISLILASRNGAEKVGSFFNSLNEDSVRTARAELVLVDSASTDATAALMESFAAKSSFPVRVLRLQAPGTGRAQNAAAATARGRLLAFTDDDCRLAPDYFEVLARDFNLGRYHYGGGAVVLGDPADDPQMANTARWGFVGPTEIPSGSLLPAGLVHGANLVFRRDVFERLGGFDPDLGPGGLMGGGDVEMVGRASALGYTGVLIPALKVLHYPGRRRGSPQADAVVERYDRARGGYYASLLLLGQPGVWELWRNALWRPLDAPETLTQLEREFRGAADYLRHRMEFPARPGRGPND